MASFYINLTPFLEEHVIGKSMETMKTHLFNETTLLEVSDSCPPYDIVKGCSDWLNRWCSLAVSSSLKTIETPQLLFTAINLASVVMTIHVNIIGSIYQALFFPFF